MPRPSAVEFYLSQPHRLGQTASHVSKLVTYGDVATLDQPGQIAGRKFYLDRGDANNEVWEDNSLANRNNDRSTLAVDASRQARTFRFTMRFRDLDPAELAALLLSFCPNQFGRVMGADWEHGYCSKLGYARPLGWGSVRIEAKELIFIQLARSGITTHPEPSVPNWFARHSSAIKSPRLTEWLAVHRRSNPDAADYPHTNGQVFSYHTTLRRNHAQQRRYS